MMRRIQGWFLVLAAAALVGGSAPLAVAQYAPAGVEAARHQPPTLRSSDTARVGEFLRDGHALEIESRWGDALAHYEDALREFPREPSLKRRFQLCRLHYDLGRRYADTSYLRTLATISDFEALNLYSEVLLKLEAHYVDQPDWKELIEQGTNALEIALDEPTFLREHAIDTPPERRDAFRRQLRATLGALVVRSRQEARDAVWRAAAMTSHALGISPSSVILEYLCGATNTRDAYSSYLTPGQLDEVYSQIEGNFVGLGIELKAENGALLIVRVIPGSPAEDGGLLDGDVILSVDGTVTQDLTTDESAELLQGEEGSVASLVAQTPGQRPRSIRVVRRRVDVPSVDDVHIADADYGVAYLKITCFQKTTARDLDAALWNLHRQGMRSLVIDLRGNPGGLLVTSVEVADKFVEQGVIVSTRGRNAQEDFTYRARQQGTWRVPLVVLIDKDSASAAEIFAGAIQDSRRGTVVGQRSYGKGSVQGIFPLDTAGCGVRLTTSKFYSPSGNPYSLVGVTPDLVVQQLARPIIPPSDAAPTFSTTPVVEEDVALTTATQTARQLVTRR